MRLEVISNGRAVPKDQQAAMLLDVSARFRERSCQVTTRVHRLPDTGERRSVAYAMLMIEIRLVKAFWTIARQPLGRVMPLTARRNGIDYIHEGFDTHARYADAPAGKWEAVAPRPSLPSAKDIDDANEALDWLLLIEDETLRKLLVVGATSKRGDAARRIAWIRVRGFMPEIADIPQRTLQHRYSAALREIVCGLTAETLR